jgi:selenocysteine-specific elongation factor
MQVVATAGHVDHGKSALVRALTGMEPDRWAEERRRGMTIDLGFAWTRLPSGERVAFVDVPGHERFTSNMLAGVGPVPVALLVVAADEGWSPQTEEHVRALHALGVEKGLLAVSKADLADPGPAMADSLKRLGRTTLAGIDAVAVSSVTGLGLEQLRGMLDALLGGLPRPDPEAPVRLWVDRSFSIRGAGTVVTGTLPAGSLARGQVLQVGGRRVTVRALQSLGEEVEGVSAPARVALNLRGIDHREVARGDALLSPGAFHVTSQVDGRAEAEALAAQLTLHIGSAAIPVSVRPLTEGGAAVRLALAQPLPLRVGDRAILREPGRRQVVAGFTVLDPAPPALRRRGAARLRAAALEASTGRPDIADELRRRGAAPRALLTAIGIPAAAAGPPGAVEAAGWLISQSRRLEWVEAIRRVISARASGSLVDAGVTGAALAQAVGLPSLELLPALLREAPELEDAGGRVRRRGAAADGVSPALVAMVARLARRLDAHPFAAPEAGELVALGFGRPELGAAAAAKLILRLPGDVVLLPDASQRAVECLREIPQPFTLSAAREAMRTTRRVAVPLLEHLDRLGVTERVDGDRRRLRRPVAQPRSAATR